jgi:DNA-binding response OmpR family regulator
VLREHGYKVVEAGTAAEALLLAEDIGDELDLLVTDVIMPRMSGVELGDRIRRRFPQMRVLFVSGFAPRSLERRGLGEGDHPVLTKPFTPDSLLRAVRAVLGQDSPETS